MNIQEMNQAFERAYIQEFGEIDGVLFFNGEKYELFTQARGFAEFHLVELKINAAWTMWQQAIKCVVFETLKNDCMIGQTWFMKGSPVSVLIKHAEAVYKAEIVAQNSKIKFGTDDNEHWFAHDVPFFGTVQIDRI